MQNNVILRSVNASNTVVLTQRTGQVHAGLLCTVCKLQKQFSEECLYKPYFIYLFVSIVLIKGNASSGHTSVHVLLPR